MDHDVIVIGSGFGGSAAARRLSEKGYEVLLMEKGKRFSPGDFPASVIGRPDWSRREGTQRC